MQTPDRSDLLIVGAGPVGLALALALADSGLTVTVVDARPTGSVASDPRTLALAHGSRITLERLGVWDALPTTPIERIHVSRQGCFGRTVLDAHDQGVPALGYVTPAGALGAALLEALERTSTRLLAATEVVSRTAMPEHVEVLLRTSGSADLRRHSSRLVACAEGGLDAGDPGIVERDYGQHALIADVTVRSGHRNRAYERFLPGGPLALLPHGQGHALVHAAAATQADELLGLDDDAYLDHLQRALGARVELTAIGPRTRFPLRLRYRRSPVAPRTVWLGNAAQTLHPVAGQGFNLALRDVQELARQLGDTPPDPGARTLLDTYAARRHLDRSATIRFTDGLLRLYGSPPALLDPLRSLGLVTLDALPPLRGFLSRRMMFGARAWP